VAIYLIKNNSSIRKQLPLSAGVGVTSIIHSEIATASLGSKYIYK